MTAHPEETPMEEVVLQNVHVRFGDKEVLKGIELQISRGDLVVLMGSSGGGKTTLLRVVAGLVTPSEGAAFVAGIPVAKKPEEARMKMGMVFQSSALFDYLTVEQNVAFGLVRHSRLKRSEIHERVNVLLEQVGLQGSNNLFPNELSGGMRKRVGIARALALDPEVMLYDEPTTGLDPITTFKMDELIAEVRATRGMTSIVVSHDLASARRLADRILFLHQGEILFDGTIPDFWASDLPPIRELLDSAEAQTLSV
ncbi:MAG: ABC transporter ATP-binding protein [Fimbriimonadaceae bacterium]